MRVRTRPGLMRVPSMSTARIMLKSDGTSAYRQCKSSFDHSSTVQRSRASETLVHVAVLGLTQFRPTFNPHTYVGWLNPDSQKPGQVRMRANRVQPGLNPGSRTSADTALNVQKLFTCSTQISVTFKINVQQNI